MPEENKEKFLIKHLAKRKIQRDGELEDLTPNQLKQEVAVRVTKLV